MEELTTIYKAWLNYHSENIHCTVSEHMGWVRNVVLMNVYFGLENPRGSGFRMGGHMGRWGKWRGQFTSNLRKRWTDPVTARRVPSKWKGANKKGSKGSKRTIMYITYLAYVYNGMIQWWMIPVVYICIIIIIGMNVVDNLNSV
jgi:hypothetical protein